MSGMKSREEWGAGPWQGEPDNLQWLDSRTGLTCKAVRNLDVGTWCGYVGVREDHPLYGVEANSADRGGLVCHGGVTFAGFWKGEEGVWWIGFDCAHAGDYLPAFPNLGGIGQYKTLGFVKKQCAALAEQIYHPDEDLAIEELPL